MVLVATNTDRHNADTDNITSTVIPKQRQRPPPRQHLLRPLTLVVGEVLLVVMWGRVVVVVVGAVAPYKSLCARLQQR